MKKDSGSDAPTTVTVTTPEQPPVVVERPAPATRNRVIGGGMIFATIGVSVLTGFLGFLGGMRLGKTSQTTAASGMTPPRMNSSSQMGPPSGRGLMSSSSSGNSSSSSTDSTSSTTTTN